MNKKTIMILLLVSICSIGFCDEIKKQVIHLDENSKASGNTYYMCVLKCDEPNTNVPLMTKNTFERSIIENCVLDETNAMDNKSIYKPEPDPIVEEETKEDLEARVAQLEKFIADNSLEVPVKKISVEVVK